MSIHNEIEALLFISDEPISIDELANFYTKEREEIRTILNELSSIKKDTGINIQIKNGYVSFITNPECGEVISRFLNPSVRIKKLSSSSMETLTIIAVKGPITKSEIENIKGVSVDNSIQVLLEKKLIHSLERKKAVGNPKLYEVTDNFYGYVGLNSKEELFELDKVQWLSNLEERVGENENK